MMDKTSRVVAIIQARMGSSRMPGKILMDIAGLPMLTRVVERTRYASTIDEVVVATTIDEEDNAVVKFCQDRGYAYIRGDNDDVLSRYMKAAQAFNADIIVRITADCPLMDPDVIDRTVKVFLSAYPEAQFGTNRGLNQIKRTYPIGMDVEVMTFDALETAFREAKEPYQREHVTPFLYETVGRFEKTSIDANGEYGDQRWAVDTPEDLTFVREIYARLDDLENFHFEDVISLLEREPNLLEINAQIEQKGMHDVG
jgi:spore coat polysaccharide biosynthesis protein SpsF